MRQTIGQPLQIPVKNRQQCKKQLRTGKQCACKVSPGDLDYCKRHQPLSNLQIDYEKEGWCVSGQNVTAAMAALQPEYCFDLDLGLDSFYAFVMHDPDAPVAKAKGNSHLHWLTVNIDDSEDVIQSYRGPAPPARSGVHHYIFSLLKQRDPIDKSTVNELRIKYEDRSNFNYEEFKQDFNMEEVEKTYFTVST